MSNLIDVPQGRGISLMAKPTPPQTRPVSYLSYVVGDGEVLQLQRPGSERAATLPSRGIGT